MIEREREREREMMGESKGVGYTITNRVCISQTEDVHISHDVCDLKSSLHGGNWSFLAMLLAANSRGLGTMRPWVVLSHGRSLDVERAGWLSLPIHPGCRIAGIPGGPEM